MALTGGVQVPPPTLAGVRYWARIRWGSSREVHEAASTLTSARASWCTKFPEVELLQKEAG